MNDASKTLRAASRRKMNAAGPLYDHKTARDRLERVDGPLYRQAAGLIRKLISSGAIGPGSELPREADLASRYGVSLITVRRALHELQGEGLIKKRAAKPAIVTLPEERPGHTFSFKSFAEIAASASDRRIKIHSYRNEKSPAAASAFGLAPDEAVFCLRATLFSGDVPSTAATVYFPTVVGAGMQRSDFDDVVIFRSIQRHLGIALSGARITVRAESADAALARALRYEQGGPVLVVEMLYFSAEGAPIEFTVNRNRADLFSLSYNAPNDLI
jgi:GntR family transcriptional regulator